MSEEQIIKMYKQGYSFERIIATHIDELIRKSTTNYYGVKKKNWLHNSNLLERSNT